MAINMTFTDYVTPVPADWLNNVNFVVNNPSLLAPPLVVSSIASLRLANKLVYQVAQVTGYRTPTDGGGGFYQLHPTDTTSLDNGGTIIVAADGGRWYLQHTTPVSVKQFGAVGNGVSDDTPFIQAAINYAQAISSSLYFPVGTYNVTGLSITAGITLFGEGEFASVLFLTTTNGTTISVNTLAAIFISDLAFEQASGATGGSSLAITGPTNANSQSIFRNVLFNNSFIGIHAIQAATWIVDSCFFANHINTGMLIENQFNADSGDSCISNCLFSTFSTNGIGITQYSSGGLKITNTKIINGAIGYALNLAPGAVTSDLMISNCSIENQTLAGIEFLRQSSTGSFRNVSIIGCEISPGTGAPCIQQTDTNNWLSNITITGNTLAFPSTIGVLLNGAVGFVVSDNAMLSEGGTTVGVQIGVNSSKGVVGLNAYNGITTPVSNSSATTTIALKTLTGAVSVASTTPAASLFFGTAAVTFPTGYFQGNPQVVASLAGGANGLCGNGVAATTGGFIAEAFSTISTTVTVNWTATALY